MEDVSSSTISRPVRTAASPPPSFSIGVTTYDRRDLLKETLSSIIGQTFPDFEVLVGNDNPNEAVTGALLEIDDDRISYINHPVNLGELANMNRLLEISRGRYFTWLADDDLYAPTFLEHVHEALIRHHHPPVVYTSYVAGDRFGAEQGSIPAKGCRLLTGTRFLGEYLARSLKVIGCYGVFRKEYLQQLGGMERLGRGFSPYSDNLLVIKTGVLDRLVYIDDPLLFFRTHEQSISFTSPDIDAYQSAQEDLLSRSRDLFLCEGLADDFHTNLFLLLNWCILDFDSVIRRSGSIRPGQVKRYLDFIRKYLVQLRGTAYYRKAWALLLRTALHIGRDMGRRRIHLREGRTGAV